LPSCRPVPARRACASIFAPEERRLTEVHLYWISGGDPSYEQRLPLVQAATRLCGELMSYRWSGLTTLRGAVRGPGALLLFSGCDEEGGMVEISLDGVALDVERPGKPGVRNTGRRRAGRLRSGCRIWRDLGCGPVDASAATVCAYSIIMA
jgi:hypothetical protein